MEFRIGIIGLGFVGGAMYDSFKSKELNVFGYDKYKISDSFEECLDSNILFLCLPTQFNELTNEYDKGPIMETCNKLEINSYNGIVVIKSTIEPSTTSSLVKAYPMIKFLHNPEFLTAATALEDFNNQHHIVLGKSESESITDDDIEFLSLFYKKIFPNAEISVCSALESESMKIFLNCFYATKIQFFNEIYCLCEKTGCDYKIVKNLMLKNNWINPMHTNVPGPDGNKSYGGYCFPKDTNALLNHMLRYGVPCAVLEATIRERNIMRKDNINIQCQSVRTSPITQPNSEEDIVQTIEDMNFECD